VTATRRGELGRLLSRNASLRDVFADDERLGERLKELQRWQAQRLRRSYADLAAQSRYRPAIGFFLDELYGCDPRRRDADLLKVQGAMQRLLPRAGLDALCAAIRLESLSQALDAAVTRALAPGPITLGSYAEAYRSTGRRADREKQVALMVEIGAYLDQVVRKPIVRGLVRLAHGPAHAAGFGVLQDFLERGLVAFETMCGATEFLGTIRTRELRALERLFAGAADPFDPGPAGPPGSPASG
jgi:hypothetical protein